MPEGADSQRVVDLAYAKYNLSLGIGLDRLKGKVRNFKLMLLLALAFLSQALDVFVQPLSHFPCWSRFSGLDTWATWTS